MLLSLGCSVNYFVVAPSRAKNFHKYIHMKRNTKQSTISYNYVMTVTFLLVFGVCAGAGGENASAGAGAAGCRVGAAGAAGAAGRQADSSYCARQPDVQRAF